MKRQKPEYIDKSITNVFHTLTLHSSQSFLIGSQSIRSLLYSNDYDLNENVNVRDTIPILENIYGEFVHIFESAKKDPNYYILDFKCGVHNGEPIRWGSKNLMDGSINIDGHHYKFEECLLCDDNTVKLDICFIYNGIFTDINSLYLLHMHNKKMNKHEDSISSGAARMLQDEIDELESDGDHYKSIKRMFSLSLLHGKYNKKMVDLMNSNYGMFYKFISFIKLVVEMLDQDFKPVDISLIKSNLEYIKQFGSHITEIDVDVYLDRLIKIIKMNDKSKMKHALDKLSENCMVKLNRCVSKLIKGL